MGAPPNNHSGVPHEELSAFVHSINSAGAEGDLAAETLWKRIGSDELCALIQEGGIKTVRGKARILACVHRDGSRCTRARSIEVDLLSEKNIRLLSEALFGLVFSRHSAAIETIIDEIKDEEHQERKELLEKALLALQKKDPSTYSPNYYDMRGVWS